MLARVLFTGVVALVVTSFRCGVSATPFGPLTLRYTRAVIPGGQVLCEWSSWIFLPKDYVEIVLIKDDDSGFDKSENQLVPTSEINPEYVGDFHLTRNDGLFELPIPFDIQSNQRYRVAIGESNKTPFGRPSKLLISTSFFIGRQPTSIKQRQGRMGGSTFSSYNPSDNDEETELTITEPSSSLYVASEPIPVRWDNKRDATRGTVLIKVVKQTDPGAWTEVGFFRMPNVGAVDLELTPEACRGTFRIEVSPENNPQGFARSSQFQFDTDSNSYSSPDRECAVEPHMLRRHVGTAVSDETEDQEKSSASIRLRRWFKEWISNISSWDPTTLEVVYLVAGCLAFLSLIVALGCCCCPCCGKRRSGHIYEARECNTNPFGIEGPPPQYYVTQQSLSGPCQQNALPLHQCPSHDHAPGGISRTGSPPAMIQQHQVFSLNSEPEPSPDEEPSAPPHSFIARRSFTFSDHAAPGVGESHTIFV